MTDNPKGGGADLDQLCNAIAQKLQLGTGSILSGIKAAAPIIWDAAQQEQARTERELIKTLEFYADRSGRGRDFVVVKRGEHEPIETIHDMGHRAREALTKIEEKRK